MAILAGFGDPGRVDVRTEAGAGPEADWPEVDERPADFARAGPAWRFDRDGLVLDRLLDVAAEVVSDPAEPTVSAAATPGSATIAAPRPAAMAEAPIQFNALT
ncbi:MAG: hypothetical protein ACOYEV_17870 [Candidatus Nanopelagicales bacterium]